MKQKRKPISFTTKFTEHQGHTHFNIFDAIAGLMFPTLYAAVSDIPLAIAQAERVLEAKPVARDDERIKEIEMLEIRLAQLKSRVA